MAPSSRGVSGNDESLGNPSIKSSERKESETRGPSISELSFALAIVDNYLEATKVITSNQAVVESRDYHNHHLEGTISDGEDKEVECYHGYGSDNNIGKSLVHLPNGEPTEVSSPANREEGWT